MDINWAVVGLCFNAPHFLLLARGTGEVEPLLQVANTEKEHYETVSLRKVAAIKAFAVNQNLEAEAKDWLQRKGCPAADAGNGAVMILDMLTRAGMIDTPAKSVLDITGKDVLPDSRLGSDLGSMMMDWTNPVTGEVHRIEVVPTFCANCGVQNPYYVPKENCVWTFWLCENCAATYGAIAGTYTESDKAFWAKVQAEMIEHYGHILNQEELARLQDQDWGPLASLIKESPIKSGDK
jgi:hypothetical protein